MSRKVRILFVDDDPNLLSGLSRRMRSLHHAQWDMVFLEDPRQALPLQLAEPFDVAVIDYTMPYMDGIALAAALRTVSDHTALIMLTGSADLDVVTQLINENIVQKFFTKPCDVSVLAQTIVDCLAERASLAQAESDQKKQGLSVAVLDRLSIGVIVCTPKGQVLQINEAAAVICAAKEGIYVDSQGALRAGYAERREDFEKALQAEEAQVGLSLERYDVEVPLTVIVSKMGDGRRLVLVSDPLTHTPPSIAVLQALYDMPLSEARLLHALVQGFSLKEAAQQINVTESSARTYLKRIFSRTATSSQPDLVRTVLLTAVPRGDP